jgi:hypothetical protein
MGANSSNFEGMIRTCMSFTSSSKSKLEKEAGWTMIMVLCCTDAGEEEDVGDKDLDADS